MRTIVVELKSGHVVDILSDIRCRVLVVDHDIGEWWVSQTQSEPTAVLTAWNNPTAILNGNGKGADHAAF